MFDKQPQFKCIGFSYREKETMKETTKERITKTTYGVLPVRNHAIWRRVDSWMESLPTVRNQGGPRRGWENKGEMSKAWAYNTMESNLEHKPPIVDNSGLIMKKLRDWRCS